MIHPLVPGILILALAGCSEAGDPRASETPKAQIAAPAGDPVDTAGMAWSYREDGPAALFGPAGGDAVVSLDCTPLAPDKNGLILAWAMPATKDVAKPMQIADQSDNRREILMNPTASIEGPEFYWEAGIEKDTPEAEFLARSDTGFTLALAGKTIALPPGDAMAQVVAACR